MSNQPPRPDTAVGTPLLQNEGKLFIKQITILTRDNGFGSRRKPNSVIFHLLANFFFIKSK